MYSCLFLLTSEFQAIERMELRAAQDAEYAVAMATDAMVSAIVEQTLPPGCVL